MKKKNLLVLMTVALVVLLLALTVACNPTDPAPERVATLTLDPAGGTVETAEYTLSVGANVYDVVKTVVPVAPDGKIFKGWYVGETPVGEDMTLPEAGLTVTAKYADGATLTLDVGIGTLEKTEYFLEVGTNVYDVLKDVVPQTDADTSFDGWFFEGQPLEEGKTLPQDGMTVYAKYHELPTLAHADVFGGGDVVYTPHTTSGDAVLKRNGLKDKTGTYDAATGIFEFAEGEKTVLAGKIVGDKFYYFRALEGTVVKSGSADGGQFKIGAGDRITYTDKEGKVTQGHYSVDVFTGEYMFYPDGEEEAKLIFVFGLDDDGKMVFFVATSEERGYYIYATKERPDPSNVLYLDGMLNSEGVGSLRAYRRISETELEYSYSGHYYLDDTFDEPTYVLYVGMTVMGRFRLSEQHKDRTIIEGLRAKGSFRTSDGYDIGAFWQNGEYVAYKQMMLADEDRTESLIVDGFDSAVIAGKKYTYELKTNTYTMFSTASGYYEWTDEWLVLTADGETRYVRIVTDTDFEPYYVDLAEQPGLKEWRYDPTRNYGTRFGDLAPNAAFYAYIVVRPEDIDGDSIEGDTFYVWTHYQDVDSKKIIYELIDYGTAAPVPGVDDTFFYTSGPLSTYVTDEDTDKQTVIPWGYYFHYENGLVVTSQYEAEQRYGENIFIDRAGTLHIDTGDDYPLEFGPNEFTMERIDDIRGEFVTVTFYQVQGGATYHLATLLKQGDGEYHEVDEPRSVIYRSFPTQDRGFLYMLMLDDTHVAIGGYANADDEECYVVRGVVSFDAASNVYDFTLDPKYDALDFFDEDSDEYLMFKDGCKLKVADDDLYYYDGFLGLDQQSFSTADGKAMLTIDGYSRAQYQEQGGSAISGDYEYICELSGEGKFFMFTADDGRARTYFAVLTDDGKFVLEKRDAEGTGLHYMMYNDGSYYKTNYIVFLGDGNVYDPLADEGGAYGTYESTGQKIQLITDGEDEFWTEYTINMYSVSYEDENGNVQTGYRYNLITTFYAETGDNIFMEQSRQTHNFEVVGVGTLSGNGYDLSKFTTETTIYYGTYGLLNVKDDSPYFDEYTTVDDWVNGKQVVFIANYAGNLQGDITQTDIDEYFLFDVADNRVQLTLRDRLTGTYAFYNKGTVASGSAMKLLYLDGYGNATIRNVEGDYVEDIGEYSVDPSDENVCVFKSEFGSSFKFSLASLVRMDRQINIYYLTDESYLFVGDDWSTLSLSTFDTETLYNAKYVDHFGNVQEGVFSFLTDNIIAFENERRETIYLRVSKGLEVITDKFVVEDKVLYAYQGDRSETIENLVIPEGIEEIGYGVFSGFYKITGTLTLNDVKKIGDYAFYNTDFYVNELKSDKVTYIGDHAFHMTLGDYFGGSASSICTIDLPNVTYIGDYAFCFNNNLNLKSSDPNDGRATFKAVTYIGDHAFSINRREAKDEVFYLDLTEVDLTKLTLHPDAFAPGPSTLAWQTLGLPVKIFVGGADGLLVTASWPEDIRKCVEAQGVITEDPFKDVSFYNFEEGTLFKFGGETGTEGLFGVTMVTIMGEATNNRFNYCANEDGSVTLYTIDGNKITNVASISGTNTQFTYDEKVYYRSNVQISLQIGEDTLAFSYTAEIVDMGFEVNVALTISGLTYNGSPVSEVEASGSAFYWEETKDDSTYTVKADFEAGSVTKKLTRKVYTSQDGKYKVTLGMNSMGGVDNLQKIELASGGVLFESASGVKKDPQKDDPYFEVTVGEGNVTRYVVELKDGKLTVTTISLKTKTVQAEAGSFEASYVYEDGSDEVFELLYLKEKDENGDLVEVKWGVPDALFQDIALVKVSKNVYRIAFSVDAKTQIVYTITFGGSDAANLTLSVNKGNSRVVLLQSEHGEQEEYHEVSIVLDDENNIIGLAGEIVTYSYESGGYYTPFSNVVPAADQLNFENSDTEVTITYTLGVRKCTLVFEKAPETEEGYIFKSFSSTYV